MMPSLECYEKLRRDVEEILSVEDNLVDGDEHLLQFVIANSGNSKIVLDFVRALKEEGNSLFKEGKFDEALEKYGYAALVLVRYTFDKDEDKVEFVDLVICLLLNFTACLGRKKEFFHVGQVCTVILEYRPSSVKALFRRAKAAQVLGRKDLAYWDLLLATEIEPKNGELTEALEEVRNTYGKDEMKSENQGEAPIGLGLSLPMSKKKSDMTQGKDQVVIQDQLCSEMDKANVMELCDLESNKMQEDGSVKDSTDTSTTIINDTSSHVPVDTDVHSGVCSEGEEINVDERPMDTCSSSNFSLSYTNVSHNSVNDESSHLAGPKYRFHNRRRWGSSFTITKADYLSMTHGKTLTFYNAKLGTYMQARVVQEQNKNLIIKSEHHFQQKKQEAKDVVDLMEASSELNSCVTVEGNQAACAETSDSPGEDEVCSSTDLVPHFQFSTKRTTKAGRKKIGVKNYCTSHSQGSGKRRKMRVNGFPSPSPITNNVCGCRFEVGKKRKYAHPPLMALCNRPRKKFSLYVCNCYFKVDCPCICYNVGCLGKDSFEGRVSYEMAHGQSNMD